MNIEIKAGVYTNNGEDVPFNFYTSLSAYNKVKFVDSVVSAIVTDDGYNYIIKDMLFDFWVVNFFTDADVSKIAEAENNIDAIEDFFDGNNIIDIVKINIAPGIIDELEKAVEFNIEYKTGIHINPISSSLSSLLDTIEGKVENIDFDSMMDIAEAMSGISGELTADKMLDAYAKTDIFKKNWENAAADNRNFNVIKGGKEASLSPILSPTV